MELRIPDEVARVLGEEPEREALEALLLQLVREERVSVAWAGSVLGLGRQDAIRWYTSHGYPFPDITPEEFEAQLRHLEKLRPSKPRGAPREQRVNVGEGEPAAEAVSRGREE